MADGNSQQAEQKSGRRLPHPKLILIGVLLIASSVFMLVTWNNGKYLKAYESIAFEVTERQDADLLEGNEYVMQPGKDGLQVIYYENKGGAMGKGLHIEKVRDPVEKILVVGQKPESEVRSDAENAIHGFMEAWRGGDYQKMVSGSSTETLEGATAEAISDAYATTGEQLTSYTVGTLSFFRNDEWKEKQKKYDSSNRDELSKPAYLGESLLVAEVEVDLTMTSKYYTETTIKAKLYLLYTDKEWKVQYFGALGKVPVGQTKTYESSSGSSNKKHEISIESIILYGDHFSIIGSERNLSTGDGYSGSVSSRLNSISVDLQSSDEYVRKVPSYSTDFKNSLDKGASQSGMISYTPDIRSGEVVEISAGYDLDFDPVKIP